MKFNAWPDSSDGPALIEVAQPSATCGPASSSTDSSFPLTKPGASFTAFTVKVKVTGFETAPLESLASTVTAVDPLKFAAGCA